MPTFRITSPDGRTFDVTAPEGATQDQVMAYVQKNAGQSKAAQQVANDPVTQGAKNFAQDMSTPDLLLSSAGKAAHDTLQGMGQMVGLADRADVADSRRLDAPMMATTAGKVGNFLGNAAVMAPAMLAGGMTIPAAAAFGGAVGLAQPSTSTGETALNTVGGAAGGAAGQWMGNKLADLAQRGATAFSKKQADALPKLTVARNASALGYVIPPEDLPTGNIVKGLSGLSGKIKTAQEASARNQTVTNDLARAAVGAPAGKPLSVAELDSIRKAAGQAYDAVGNAGMIQPGPAYAQALDNLTASAKRAAQGFPNAKASPIITEIESLKSHQFDAASAVAKISELRARADKAYADGDKDLGKALKGGAKALEDVIDDHLVKIGAPTDLLKNFRDARQLIAKTYSVQKGLNDVTGDVSAQALAKQLQEGKPLSGELRDIAEAGAAFPKATQSLKETPKATSPLDWVAAIGTSIASGNPLPMAMVGARPMVRNILLSKVAQQNAMKDMTPGFSQAILENRLTQLMGLPLGINAGVAGAGLGAKLASQ